jgi:hypothetical protein
MPTTSKEGTTSNASDTINSSAGSRDNEVLINLLGSSTAGLISRFICHPIDTIKSRKQSGFQLYTERRISTLRMVYETLRAEGFAGLYRGFGAVAIGGTPGVCLYLTSYEVCASVTTSIHQIYH